MNTIYKIMGIWTIAWGILFSFAGISALFGINGVTHNIFGGLVNLLVFTPFCFWMGRTLLK